MRRLYGPLLLLALGLSPLPGCQSATDPVREEADPHHGATPAPRDEDPGKTAALDLSALSDLNGIIPKLAERRVIFVGEQHDRFDHHLNQLEIIRALHARGRDLAVGLEFFQQPFQAALDDYVAGRIDGREMLERTEYYERWRFDFRLYHPILAYAREHGIPLVALNVPAEITSKVSRNGLASLAEEERRWVPAEMDRSNERYRSRIRSVYDLHPKGEMASFDNFLDSQLLWDEGMAERAARYLDANPGKTLVVLAGNGHVMFGDGIPARLGRRIGAAPVVVVNGQAGGLEPGLADYVLLPDARDLPPPGRLGVVLEPDAEAGGMRIRSVSADGAALAAGLEEGDRLTGLNGKPLRSMADVRVSLWDKQPGDAVRVSVLRKRWLGGERRLDVEIRLR